MRVPSNIMREMRKILPTRRDVRKWWDSPSAFLGGKSPHEQFRSDEAPIMELIESYLVDDIEDEQRRLDGLDGMR